MFSQTTGVEGLTQDGTARFKIRVRVANALATLNVFPEELIRRSIRSIPNEVWRYVLMILAKFDVIYGVGRQGLQVQRCCHH